MSRDISFQAKKGKIWIDDQVFDWGLDDEAIREANKRCANLEFARAIHADIMEHFLDSLSEVLGFKPSMKQVNEALKSGFISK